MNNQTIATWFAAYHRQQVRQQRLVAAGLALLGAAVLLVEWVMLLLVCWPLAGREGLASGTLLLGTLVVVLLLFVVEAVTREEEVRPATPPEAGALDGALDPALATRLGMVGGGPSALGRTGSRLRLYAAYLLSGPSFIGLAREQARAAAALAAIDGTRMAPVIAVLHAHEHKVPYEELAAAVPGFDPSRDLPALQRLDGILFLHKDPAGLALGSALRAEMDRHLASVP